MTVLTAPLENRRDVLREHDLRLRLRGSRTWQGEDAGRGQRRRDTSY